MTDDEMLQLQAEAARCGMAVDQYLAARSWGVLFSQHHRTCDDPDCAICVQREQDAAAELRGNPRINRSIAKIKEIAKRRSRRPQA